MFIIAEMDSKMPELSDSEESDSDGEELTSSPPAIYGFSPGPVFQVAEEAAPVMKVKGVATEEVDVEGDVPGLSESEDSDFEEEDVLTSPRAIYGFSSGPRFLVAEEEVTKVNVKKIEVMEVLVGEGIEGIGKIGVGEGEVGEAQREF